jgi:hypothetical protein
MSRKDKGESRQVEIRKSAEDGTASVTIKLYGTSAMKKITTAGSRARALVKEYSLPWRHGWNVIPTGDFQTYSAAMGIIVAEHRQAVDEFIREYRADWDAGLPIARGRLQGLFNMDDFRHPDLLDMDMEIQPESEPMDSGFDSRIDLPESIKQDMERQLRERMEKTAEDAMKSLWLSVSQPLKELMEAMDSDKGFEYTRMSSVIEACDRASRLNLTSDPRLSALVAKAKAAAAAMDPATIRNDPAARSKAAAEARELYSEAGGMPAMPKLEPVKVQDMELMVVKTEEIAVPESVDNAQDESWLSAFK